MKRNLVLSALLLLAAVVLAQQPVITFTKTTHDFGKINEGDGRVTTIFEFKNEGMEPLVLSMVKASCGCTTPNWTKTPVEPGQTGTISVTYNPNGRPGRFQKTVTVTSNASEPTVKLFIKGEVIPKQAKPVNKYPVQMGELSLNGNNLNFGTIYKGKNLTKTITYTNNTDQDVTVDVLTADGDPIIAQASLTTVKKGQEGQLNINFDAALTKVWGQQTYRVYVVVNGKKQLTNDYAISLTATVEEDFSGMSASDKQNAPIVEVQKSIDLGVVAAGKKMKKELQVRNSGPANPLFIRTIVNQSTGLLRTSFGKGGIRSGKAANISIEVNTLEANGEALKPGEYHRIITLVTNDPLNPKVQIQVNWSVK